MNVTTLPKRYGSMFRPACFSLAGVEAPDGIDIAIFAIGRNEPLGVKRVYSATTASINVAPYARRLLEPSPLCGLGAGIHGGTGRNVACFVSAPGFSSSSVILCGGSEDAAANILLSTAPGTVSIATGERDEMPIISEDWVSPVVTFSHRGTTYTDTSIGQINSGGIVAAVIDADAVCRSFSSLTGAAASELVDFTVRLKLEQSGFAGRIVQRRYVIDRSTRGGKRLAWLNRFGAIDYHTFPVAEEFRSGGSRTRIETPVGYRTVATAKRQSLRLLSRPCDAATAEWLSDILSSPAVWTIDGGSCEKVEVAAGEVVCSPLRPAIVSVSISPSAIDVSRKL